MVGSEWLMSDSFRSEIRDSEINRLSIGEGRFPELWQVSQTADYEKITGIRKYRDKI